MMKIMVAGVPGVGKTSFFYGMLSKMMNNQRDYKIGLSGGNQTIQHISSLMKLSLPSSDRFPKKVNRGKHIHLGYITEKRC